MAAQQAAATSGASTSSSNSLAQSTSASTIGSNFNTFINILTTQLQHQDPTNASDPNQFTQELVQFAGVEQQFNTNNDLQTLINLQKNSSGATAALNYMGQYVQGAGTPTVNSPCKVAARNLFGDLKTPAASVSIAIEDFQWPNVGNVCRVRAIPARTTLHGMAFRILTGTQQPDGTYKFVITATNADGSTQTPTSTESDRRR